MCVDVGIEHANSNAPITNSKSVEYISMFTFEVCKNEEALCALYLLNSWRLRGHACAVLKQTPFERRQGAALGVQQ